MGPSLMCWLVPAEARFERTGLCATGQARVGKVLGQENGLNRPFPLYIRACLKALQIAESVEVHEDAALTLIATLFRVEDSYISLGQT